EGFRFPRHRAERRGNRRPSSGQRRSLVAPCAAFLLGGAIVGGALVSGMVDPAPADASARGAAIGELTASASEDVLGGHARDADYWDVDVALATDGGSASYLSLS
ncbi:hypothetical protein, partial [Agromyces binzhouensis]|uniref:hypothetical protein n=1 Tax=Agromyces binzhouensis TaxID=1817495 RepID=UPI0013EB6CEE